MREAYFNHNHPRRLALALVGASLIALLGHPPNQSVLAALGPTQSAGARVSGAFGKLPLLFLENRGQLDARVSYYVQGRDNALYFTADGSTFTLLGDERRRAAAESPSDEFAPRAVASGTKPRREQEGQRWALKLDFVNANHDVLPTGQDLTPAGVSYFKGARDQWQTELNSYATLLYTDLWPGIDLLCTGTSTRLNYKFLVKPGADPHQIRLAYRGATSVRVTAAGQLEVATPAGVIHNDIPLSYQELDGHRVEVKAAYALEADTSAGSQFYGLRVGDYDQDKPLVLEPAVLVDAGLIGGVSEDVDRGIAVDRAGDAYVTGRVETTELFFPETAGAFEAPDGGGRDAFMAKVDPKGLRFLYVNFIGGAGEAEGLSISVDEEGSAQITGRTASTADSFPATVAPDPTPGSRGAAFMARVSAEGRDLIYCGYGESGDSQRGGDVIEGEAGERSVSGTEIGRHSSTTVEPEGSDLQATQFVCDPNGKFFNFWGLGTLSSPYNETLTGEINPSSEQDKYCFMAKQWDVVTIRMTKATPSLDPYLSLNTYTDDGTGGTIEVARDDDSGGNLNALINRFRLTLPSPRWDPSWDWGRSYYVLAKSYAGLSSGSYNISLTVEPCTALPCDYSLSNTGSSFIGNGGQGSVKVTTPGCCSWTAVSNASWIKINYGSSGTGSAWVGFSVAVNNTGYPRTGTIKIASKTYTVTQNQYYIPKPQP